MVTIAKFRLGNLSGGVIARANKRDESPTMAALELIRLGLEAEKRLLRIREHCSMALRIPEAREDCLRWVLEAATIDGNEPTTTSPERSPDGIPTNDLDRRVDPGSEELA